MIARILCIAIFSTCGISYGQELTGDEACQFLAAVGAKIKANCNAIKSWKGKIQARHNKGNVSANFTIAKNGDVHVQVDKLTGTISRSSLFPGVISARAQGYPLQYEFFIHGGVVEESSFASDSLARNEKGEVHSPRPPMITNQSPSSVESIHTTFLNPLELLDAHRGTSLDEYFGAAIQNAAKMHVDISAKKSTEEKGIWIIQKSITLAGQPPSSKQVETWRLDENRAFLPLSRTLTNNLGEIARTTTYEYEQFSGITVPKKVIFKRSKWSEEFDIQTESLNAGPDRCEVKHQEGDRLNDLNGKRFEFEKGEFRLAE